MKDNRNYSRLFIIIADFILVDFCLKLAHIVTFGKEQVFEDYYIFFFLIFNFSWLCSALFCHVYNGAYIFEFKSFLKHLFFTLVGHILIVGIILFSFDRFFFSRMHLLYTYTFLLSCLILFRFLLSLAYGYYRSISYNIRKIVVVGPGNSSKALYEFFNSQDATVYRFMDDIPENEDEGTYQRLVKEHLQELKQFCMQEKVNEIYFAIPLTSSELIDDIAEFADDNFIHFRIVSDFRPLRNRPINVDMFGHIPIITLRKEPLRVLLNRIIKRAFDIVFSLMVILFIFPILFPLIAIAIKLESRGPVIFSQLRSGYKNNDFTVYKFRTMTVNKKSDSQQAKKGDARITKVGAFLRKTSLDEFPQFVNVFFGHMSVVGPRPHMLKHTEEYSKIIDKYLFRHFIVPGITGYAQIKGFRGETSDPSLMQKRIEHDTWYIENWSFFLDLKIIFLTVWNAVRGEENAY